MGAAGSVDAVPGTLAEGYRKRAEIHEKYVQEV
jgi:hypothetical protein